MKRFSVFCFRLFISAICIILVFLAYIGDFKITFSGKNLYEVQSFAKESGFICPSDIKSSLSAAQYDYSAFEGEKSYALNNLTSGEISLGDAIFPLSENYNFQKGILNGGYLGNYLVSCSQSLYNAYFASGNESGGSSGYILLINPNDIATEVDITLYSQYGIVLLSTDSSYLVDKNSYRIIPLSAFGISEDGLSIEISSSKAPIVSYYYETKKDGLSAQGFDIIASSYLSDNAVFPYVKLESGEGLSLVNILRLLSPNANTKVYIYAENMNTGDVFEAQTQLAAFEVYDFDLSVLSPGEYFIRVESESEVLSGLRIETQLDDSKDFDYIFPSLLLYKDIDINIENQSFKGLTVYIYCSALSSLSLNLDGQSDNISLHNGFGIVEISSSAVLPKDCYYSVLYDFGGAVKLDAINQTNSGISDLSVEIF